MTTTDTTPPTINVDETLDKVAEFSDKIAECEKVRQAYIDARLRLIGDLDAAGVSQGKIANACDKSRSWLYRVLEEARSLRKTHPCG